MRLILSETDTGVWLQLEGESAEEWGRLDALAAYRASGPVGRGRTTSCSGCGRSRGRWRRSSGMDGAGQARERRRWDPDVRAGDGGDQG
jgi:hypothetical protein